MVFNAVQIIITKRGGEGSKERRMPFKAGRHKTSACVNVLTFLWLGAGRRSPAGQGPSGEETEMKLVSCPFAKSRHGLWLILA